MIAILAIFLMVLSVAFSFGFAFLVFWVSYLIFGGILTVIFAIPLMNGVISPVVDFVNKKVSNM